MKTRVGVFFGGQSVEHEISILTAMQVMAAIDTDIYDVVPIYVAKDGLFYSDSRFFKLDTFRDLVKALDGMKPVFLMRKDQRFALVQTYAKCFEKIVDVIDIAFNAFHGTNGEDGTFAGYCQMLGLPCTGCTVDGASVGQDKVFMKQILQANKIPVCSWIWRYDHEIEQDKKELYHKINRMGYPVIVKPATLGSSIGIRVVDTIEQLDEALEEAAQYSDKIIIEKKIVHLREFNCAYLGMVFEGMTSRIEEVVFQHAMLTYEDKYEDALKLESGQRVLPADIDEELAEKIKYLTIKSCRVLHLQGVIRVDFLYDIDRKQLYVNEVNTIPGSLAYYLFEDISFEKIVDTLLQDVVKKERIKSRRTTSYSTNLLANYDGSKGLKMK